MSTISVFFWVQPVGPILKCQSDQEDGTGKLYRNVCKNRNTKGKIKVIPLQARCGPEFG
jgi:hypothetical protein